MKAIERRQFILQMLQTHGSVNIAELAERLEVSSMTIRRDLNSFAEEGLITMAHGGAILNKGSLFEFNAFYKQSEKTIEKKMMAQEAIGYINEGDSVFLDSGTTVKEVADLCVTKKNIVILTHSLLVANALSESDSVRVVMCPGEFRKISMAYMGPLTTEFISKFKIDTLFLGVEGVDLDSGVSVPDILDGATKISLVEQAERIICIADHSKFNKSFLFKICPLEKLDLIITDANLDRETIENFKRHDIPLIVSQDEETFLKKLQNNH